MKTNQSLYERSVTLWTDAQINRLHQQVTDKKG